MEGLNLNPKTHNCYTPRTLSPQEPLLGRHVARAQLLAETGGAGRELRCPKSVFDHNLWGCHCKPGIWAFCSGSRSCLHSSRKMRCSRADSISRFRIDTCHPSAASFHSRKREQLQQPHLTDACLAGSMTILWCVVSLEQVCQESSDLDVTTDQPIGN